MKVFDSKTKNTLESANPIMVKAWMSDTKRYKEVGAPDVSAAVKVADTPDVSAAVKVADTPDAGADKKK